jgi:hypothetical protein
MEYLFVAIFLVLGIPAAVTILLAVWHLVMMTRGLKNRWTAGALGPLILFFPRILSESGVDHRSKFLRYLLMSIALVLCLLAIFLPMKP